MAKSDTQQAGPDPEAQATGLRQAGTGVNDGETPAGDRPPTDVTEAQRANPGGAFSVPGADTTHGLTPAQQTQWLRDMIIDFLQEQLGEKSHLVDAHYQFDGNAIEVATVEGDGTTGLYAIRVDRIR